MCDANANCENTDGSYICQCHTGYTGDGAVCSGRSINNRDGVNRDLKCTFSTLVYSLAVIILAMHNCPCHYFYSRGNSINISDINECANEPCGDIAQCSNTAGSYSCICDPGYTWTGTICAGDHMMILFIYPYMCK